MHPKNIYRHPPSFKDLAITYPSFRQHVKVDLSGNVKFDFQNPEALRELTKTLLKKDFNLDVEFPIDKLIPTVPLRLNYILWIDDLLTAIELNGVAVLGVDVGTGASCIYPLLAAKKGWRMLATEVNSSSVKVARENVERNSLTDLVTIQEVEGCKLVLKGVIDDSKVYHFSMCNPPFFTPNETPEKRTEHRPPPKNAHTGEQAELETDGGEVAFVTRMIEESVDLKDNILIFSTMVGKRSSLKALKPKVEACNVKSLAVTEFQQGRTTRWGLAWSFSLDLPKTGEIQEKKKAKDKKLLPLVYELPDGTTLGTAIARLKQLITELKMTQKDINATPFTCQLIAEANTWANQRRKRRQMMRQHEEDESPPEKKAKTEESPSASEARTLLEFEVKVYTNESTVMIESAWISGSAGKDGVHQVMQYLKNNWIPVLNG